MMKFFLIFFIFALYGHRALASTGSFKLFIQGVSTRSSLHPRNIYLYLPPGYDKSGKIRYPVLYMHDGQNLFDPSRSSFGETWKVTETLNRLITRQIIPPIIVVGIDNTPDRLHEYAHDWEQTLNAGGRAHAYVQYLIFDLKRYIDHVYPTRPEARHTAIMGSSLGGLVSLYAGARFPESFGLVGALSPSIWWNNKSILPIIRSSTVPDRVYLDSGTGRGERPEEARLVAKIYRKMGTKKVHLLIQSDASHQERFWAQRLPFALRFLFN
jgi:predicted alpha/beta superfamily hydrolase